jgi:Lon protease-like protein
VVAIREGAETGPATPHDVGTLAKIIRIERLEDGRMNLLVSGASRFEIVKTDSDRPYLRGQIRIIPEAGDDLEATARLTEETALAFRRYSNLVRALVGQEPQDPEPPMEPELLSYLIAAALNLQVPEKQALLAQRRTDERLALELRILRKEIALLNEMVNHAQTASARASLN